MNLERHEVAALLQQQAMTLQVKVLSIGLHSELEIDGEYYLACLLSKSSDYYQYRVNLHGSTITMLVVGEHNTRISIPVLALDEGYFYAPAEAPRWYDSDAVRTRKDAMVVIGGLLSGVEEAYRQVEHMKRSTRYRYLAHMRHYLSAKQGRQFIV